MCVWANISKERAVKKKILSLILTLCLLLGAFPFVVGTSAADAITADIEISTADQLVEQLMDPENAANWSKTIVLTADIDLATYTGTKAQAPIGNSTTAFTGTFDGQGHTVSGIDLSGGSMTGFFGKVQGATIRNLTVNGNVKGTAAAVGGLIGYGIVPLTIENCVNRIHVSGKDRSAGFVGSVDLTKANSSLIVRNCKNYGEISSSAGVHIGGFFGRLYKTGNSPLEITDCANYGKVSGRCMAGGLVGRYESGKASTVGETVITGFANYGDITTTGEDGSSMHGGHAGGMAGLFTNNAGADVNISVIYNKGTIRTEGGKYAGGIVGYYRSYKTTASLSDAFNEGSVYSVTGSVGGVIGAANGADVAHKLSRLYNAGEVTFGAGSQYVGAVVGANAAKAAPLASAFYSTKAVEVTEEVRNVTETIVTPASTIDENKALFPELAAASDTWMITTAGAELRVFHVHNFVDGACTACGEVDQASCKHEFGEWKVVKPATATKDGEKVRTCKKCGYAETETIRHTCEYHQWLPTEDGYKCVVCDETAETLTAPITLRIESVRIANGTATVTVSLAATEALKGLRFRVVVPAGLTYVSASTTLAEIPDADALAPSGFSFGAGTDSMVLLNFDEQTLASFDKNNILALTYTAAEGFDAETADFTIELLEVLDDDAKALQADGIGYTWSASAHEHKYVETITKEANCGEDGEKLFKCDCGDSYTQKIPATGKHTFGEWIVTTPAQVGVKGEETRTCAVCKKTETRDIDPLPEPEVYVAYIGEVGYKTVQAAFDAAKALETIDVEEGVTETVTPKTTVYLAGNFSGITVAGDYTLDVTGRYVRADGKIVEDSIIPYTPAQGMKAIVRPNAMTAVTRSEIPVSAALQMESAIELLVGSTKTNIDARYKDYYVVLELCGTDGKTLLEGSSDFAATRLVLTDKLSVSDTTKYQYVFSGISAKCMNNAIKINCYGILADGSVETRTVDYGIHTYLYNQLHKSGISTAERAFYAAVLNYGAAAQRFFDYNLENPVNANLDASLKRDVIADFSGDTVVSNQTVLKGALDADETAVFAGMTIAFELQDKVNIVLKARPANASQTDFSAYTAVYTFTDAVTGEKKTVVLPGSEWAYDTAAKRPVLNVNGIDAKNLRQMLEINIYENYGTGNQKRVITTYTLEAGAEYYGAKRVSDASASDTEKTVYYALMHYADSALAYFKK